MVSSKEIKNEILKKSLTLFNSNGFFNVSIRTIAKKLNISDGNTRYYFKTKESLLEMFFFELKKEYVLNNNNLNYFKNFQLGVKKIVETKYKYSFIFQEEPFISNKYRNLIADYEKLRYEKNNFVSDFLKKLIEEEDIIYELENSIELLKEQINLILDSNFNIYLKYIKGNKISKIDYIVRTIMCILVPYLKNDAKSELIKTIID